MVFEGTGGSGPVVEGDGAQSGHAPMRAPWVTVDSFLGASDAAALRGHIESHFADPQNHSPAVHQVWNYWYVPELYTYLRTSPEKIIPRPLVDAFHARLRSWAAERLGLDMVSWPNLSLYVDGCVQHLHNDACNGRFGFVYSLTLDSRRSRGGETIVLREGDLFRSHLTRPAAAQALQELIEPRFDRLTIFDDRMPHGVRLVEGGMDPREGRIVLHGHISETRAWVAGPLPVDAVWAGVRPAVDSLTASVPGGAAGIHGPLTLRLRIAADGSAAAPQVLVDRVVRASGGDARDLVDALVAKIGTLRFPAQGAASEATLPIMFGGPLPWMEKEAPAVVTTAAPVLRAPATEGLISTSLSRPARLVPAPESPRARIGADVRARLAGTKGVARIPKDRLEAYVVPDFVTREECDALMALIDAGRAPSGLLAPTPDTEFRTSESCNLDPADPVVAGLEARINALMGIEPHFAETVQGQRYAVGQQFKPHHDFFHTNQSYWKVQEKIGGQRTWTVMAFLNKPEAGGQTQFPKAGIRITPAPGYLLIWNNMDVAGEPNDFSLHQGCPVEAGVKYVVTKWYRERPWGVAS